MLPRKGKMILLKTVIGSADEITEQLPSGKVLTSERSAGSIGQSFTHPVCVNLSHMIREIRSEQIA